MMSNDRLEIVGIVLGIVGLCLLSYGTYLLAAWLAPTLAGIVLTAVGAMAIYRANRGSE